MLKGLYEEEEIKNMNNKMAINIYLLTTESKKINKQKRKRITDTEHVLTDARWEGHVGPG